MRCLPILFELLLEFCKNAVNIFQLFIKSVRKRDMEFFNTMRKSDSYQEIDPPAPRRGQMKTLLNILCVFGFATFGLLVVNSFTSVSIPKGKSSLKNSGDQEVIVKLKQGAAMGRVGTSRAGREYLEFLGIPYAKPPLGNLRFEPPVKADAWEGILNATKFTPECPQRDRHGEESTFKGNEDCLYLNIYTPKTMDMLKNGDSRPFPVMVHIHGGGDQGNATKYGSEYFMDEDVILVSFHYRIGVLGNLNTNDGNARGNQGLKDHIMALRWVQENIHNFGGNRDKVTIFGNSGGGMHVTSHLLSPMSKGLFHGAISESGTLIMPEVFDQNQRKKATELGIKLNCTVVSTKDLVDCFRSKPVEDLIGKSEGFQDFATTVEPPSDSNDVFLSDLPLKLIMNGKVNRVPVMFGVTASEGLHFSLPVLISPNLTVVFNEHWDKVAGKALWLDTSPTLQDPERIAHAAQEFYLGSNKLSREVEHNFTQMFTDRRNIHPANVFSKYQLQENRKEDLDVYRFYFTEPVGWSHAQKSLEKYGTNESLGPAHGDELQFLFTYPPFPLIPLGSKNANFSQMLIRLFVTFAENGKPTGTSNGVEWLPVTQEKPYEWFELSHEPKMTNVLSERMKFWDSFNLTDLYI